LLIHRASGPSHHLHRQREEREEHTECGCHAAAIGGVHGLRPVEGCC
jgi:hypothetical protein